MADVLETAAGSRLVADRSVAAPGRDSAAAAALLDLARPLEPE